MLNGQYLAKAEDLIVVTVNYRTGIFGFPGAPDISPNLGIKDQRVAVEWIRDNIRGFGGDPEKIIIAGQSAGAMSVDYWPYAYQQDPIVKGIIAMSGTAFSYPTSQQPVRDNFASVVASVNCTSSNDALACMRGLNWKTIQAAAITMPPSGKAGSNLQPSPPFRPVVDGDVIVSDYLNKTMEGQFAKIVSLKTLQPSVLNTMTRALCADAILIFFLG